MRVPAKVDLATMQAAFRDVWTELDRKVGADAKGVMVINAREASIGSALVTLAQLDRKLAALTENIRSEELPEPPVLFQMYEAYLAADDPGGGGWEFDTVVESEDHDDTAFTLNSGTVVCNRGGRWLVFAHLTFAPPNDGDHDCQINVLVNRDGATPVAYEDYHIHTLTTYPLYSVDIAMAVDLDEDGLISFSFDFDFGSGHVMTGGFGNSRVTMIELARP